MGEEYPRESAFDSKGNPLFTSDGNIASAADAARFQNEKLYVYGESLHSGPVYDGWGRQVRGTGEPASVPLRSSGDFVDNTINQGVGCAVTAVILGFFYLVTGPLDRWLMNLAKGQTSRAHELEEEVAKVSGLNFGGFFSVPFFSWLWLLLFLRLPFALITLVFLYLIIFIPLFGPLTVLLMWGLLLIRGNEWAWYSGKWATIDSFKAAKKRWAYALLGLFVIYFLLSIGSG
jgi:hypothetical protein